MSSDLLDKLNAMGKALYERDVEYEKKERIRVLKEVTEVVDDFRRYQDIIDMMAVALEVMQSRKPSKSYEVIVSTNEEEYSRKLTMTLMTRRPEKNELIKVSYRRKGDRHWMSVGSPLLKEDAMGVGEYDVVKFMFKYLHYLAKKRVEVSEIPSETFDIEIPPELEDGDLDDLCLQTSTWLENRFSFQSTPQ